jgi:hypothetical protein
MERTGSSLVADEEENEGVSRSIVRTLRLGSYGVVDIPTL